MSCYLAPAPVFIFEPSVKCLVSCSALVAQPAAGQLLTPLIRESSDATFENCPKSDTSSGAFGTRVAGKNALFCGKKVLFSGKKEGDTHVLRSVMFTPSGLVVCASRRFWQTERVQPGLMQDRMNAVRIRVFTLLFFEGRMPLNPCTFFPD